MKIELDNNTKETLCWFFIITGAAVIAWAFAWGYVASWRSITTAGYSQQPRQSEAWVAPSK